MKPRIAIHKFSSCDGCQLAFLNAGEALLALADKVEIVHFAEAGPVDTDANVDIAFIEGSVATAEDSERIRRVRANSRFLVTIGACATSGGIQALRNRHNATEWLAEVYASPETIDLLSTSTAIAEHVKVDMELWGCPVNTRQIVATVSALLLGSTPVRNREKVCMDCKRQQAVCVMVTSSQPCMGPVTGTGCGALCPSFGRDCYGCFGPSEMPNTRALGRRFTGIGLRSNEVARRFLSFNNASKTFASAADEWGEQDD